MYHPWGDIVSVKCFAILTTVLVLVANSGCGNRVEFTPETFATVKAGMSEEKVLETLGRPSETLDREETRRLFWETKEKYYSISFKDGKVIEPLAHANQQDYLLMKAFMQVDLKQADGGVPPAEAKVLHPSLSLSTDADNLSHLHLAADGKSVVALARQMLHVWDLEKKEKRSSIPTPGGSAMVATLSPHGNIAAVGGYNAIWLVNLEKGKEIAQFRKRGGNLDFTPRILFLPDDDIVIGVSGKEIVGWHDKSGDQLFVWPEEHRITAASDLFEGGEKFAIGNDKGQIKIWDIGAGKAILTLFSPAMPAPGGTAPNQVQGLAATGDGKKLASRHTLGPIRIWDAAAGKMVKDTPASIIPGLGGVMLFMPDNKTLVFNGGPVGKAHSEIYVFDTVSGRITARLEGHTGNFLTAMALTPDGTRLVSAGTDKTLKVWDLQGIVKEPLARVEKVASADAKKTKRRFQVPVVLSEPALRLQTKGEGYLPIALSPDGSWLAVGQKENIILVDTATGKERATFPHPATGPARGMFFSPDGKFLLFDSLSFESDDSIRIKRVSVPEGKPADLALQTKDYLYPLCLRFTKERRLLGLFDNNEGELIVRDVEASKILARSKMRPAPLNHGGWQVSTDGTRGLAAHDSTQGSKVVLVQWQPKYQYTILESYPNLLRDGSPRATAGCPESDLVAVASSPAQNASARITLWDLTTGSKKDTWAVEGDEIPATLAMSHDGRWLASSPSSTYGPAKNIYIWNLATRRKAVVLQGMTKAGGVLVFSADSSKLAACEAQGTVFIWDLAKARLANQETQK